MVLVVVGAEAVQQELGVDKLEVAALELGEKAVALVQEEVVVVSELEVAAGTMAGV